MTDGSASLTSVKRQPAWRSFGTRSRRFRPTLMSERLHSAPADGAPVANATSTSAMHAHNETIRPRILPSTFRPNGFGQRYRALNRYRRSHRYPDRMSASTVRIVFLGGLGEIGRNCMCLEVDDRILIIDCGIMFPESDMPGIDLVLPDFTYLRENADRVEAVFLTHAHEDHAGGLAFLLPRHLVPDVRLAAVARPRPQPHRRSRHARAHRAHPRARRRAADDRPVRLRVHPRHALGAARVRHRVPHACGHDHAQRRLQARPHAGRRPQDRPLAHGRDRQARRAA